MQGSKTGMDEAIEEWLDSREGFERYLAATQNLYAVFSQSWQGSRRNLVEAFADFREALVRETEYTHLEVTEVCPNRHHGY